MAMVSMLPEKEDYPTESMCCGLELYLNDDQCEKLGITKPIPAGTVLSMRALVLVRSVTESMEQDGDDSGNDVSMCIQVTDMELTGAQTKRLSEAMYGD